ncbi:glycoside hydrolase family 18 protein [Amanita muscaria Koide BX008]|uniref:Glycoside hydrolase family 18 protein n=1 Tax=Amanita muscaria (strain Koide BX008) TaxID=946122 RepID=A0A0C2WGR7_AMAMK|nr:glycoside hydrolase family 18 protein [Amanita muscaria Koide BX008]
MRLSHHSLILIVLSAVHLVCSHVARAGSPKVAAAWYGGWSANSNPPVPISQLSWSKYTHLIYSFAETTPDVKHLNLSGANPQLLPTFVEEAHKHGVKASLSVGGWTGSRFWSSNVGSAANRTWFINTLTALVLRYNLDGLDFDWEYPGRQGVGCNVVNPKDTANFLSFLQELRQHPVGAKLVLSAATSIFPFADGTGSPSTNVAQFADVLDRIAIMNYDIYGPWSGVVGPNAPLNDSCAPLAYQQGSATSAVKKWIAAGFPASKIVLGVAAYGHSFRVKPSDALNGGSLVPYPPFDKSNIPRGDSWSSPAGTDVCGNPTPTGDTVDFWGAVALGYLDHNGKPQKGIAYRYDTCSKTAYAYNTASGIMISYDDTTAFSAKGTFIRSSGLLGFSMWMAGADYHDLLLDSIRSSTGF